MSRTPFPRLDSIARSLLKDAPPRTPADILDLPGKPRDPGFGSPAEQTAAALGALLVWKLVEHGGCNLPVGPAQLAAERLLEPFSDIDRHRIETESVELFNWLEDALNLLGDDWSEAEDRGMYPWEDREFPDDGKLDLIRQAIDMKRDLQIEYFTYRRNTMSRRRITPLALEGEHILRARCHWRQEERSFAVHRIKSTDLT